LRVPPSLAIITCMAGAECSERKSDLRYKAAPIASLGDCHRKIFPEAFGSRQPW
jgi:hypothetical protein